MTDQRNLLLAIVISVTILVAWEFYTSLNRPPPSLEGADGIIAATPDGRPAPVTPGIPSQAPDSDAAIPTAPGGATAGVEQTLAERSAAIEAGGPRVTIQTPRLNGSILLKGALLDDLTLTDYREELDLESPPIVLFSPKGSKNAYYAQHGWVGSGGIAVPGGDTVWAASGNTLSEVKPVTLTWDNGQGLVFTTTYSIDENFMFTITQRVKNSGTSPARLLPYGLISRQGTPEVTGFLILHEGLLGVFDDTLLEVDYDELQDEGEITQPTTGGWTGITDKYWLTALIPDQENPVNTRFLYNKKNGTDLYQVDYLAGEKTAPPRGMVEYTAYLFAGAKEVALLDGYETDIGVSRFDLAIDFGWFYFLTKPIFYTLIYINEQVGNFGVSILLLTVLIKMIFFPLANKSYKAMSKMKKLQPEMVKMRERFGDDKVRLNQEMMALYKREKANPVSGCLPMIVQIPVFFALYKVLFVTIEMRQAPFFGWIQDLSAPDPTSFWNLFGLIPWDPSLYIPAAINIGIWPLVMGGSMFLQQKLNPQPTDPIQAKIFLFLPLMFTFLLAQFPAGLVVYWAWNNTLSIIQQKVIMHRMGVK